MGLRNRTSQPFWRVTPTSSADPSALYQHGIECVGRRDGKGMIATGWTLCQVASLHEHQAADFLTDGYRMWRDDPGFDRAQASAFLVDLFGALNSIPPPAVPNDIWSAPPESVMPASIYFGTRCWAGNELLEVAPDPAIRAQYEPQVFRSVSEAPHDFVPTRSIEFAKSYAAAHGLNEPWVIVLPAPREQVLAGADAVPASSGSGAGDATQVAQPRPRPTPGGGQNGGSSETRPTPVFRPEPTQQDTTQQDTTQQEQTQHDAPAPAHSLEKPQQQTSWQPPDPQHYQPQPQPQQHQPQQHQPQHQPQQQSATVISPVLGATSAASPAPADPGTRPSPRPRPTPTPAGTSWAPPSAAPAPQQQAPAPQQAPQQAPTQAPQQQSAPETPPRVEELRRTVLGWLQESYRGVRVEDNGWITIPDIGPSVLQIETALVSGDHLKAEIFTPLLIDVPLTADLFRHVALEGGRFHFGTLSIDADASGDANEALLQFTHSMLADSLSRDEFLAVIWLAAATVVEQAPRLQQRFGGSLFCEFVAD